MILNTEIIEYTTSPKIISSFTFGYFLTIYSLLKYVEKSKQIYSLKKAMYIYNISQIILNIYMIHGLLEIVSFPNIYGINSKYTDKIRYYTYIHYISKYLDYLDTFFIILRGKNKQQLSFLHVYHHSSIGVIWGYLLNKGHGNGTASYGCFINSVVHLIMYMHYLLTSLGYRNPFKKYITQVQLFQFITCLSHSVLVINYEDIVPKKYAFLEFFYHISMLLLFSKFYINTYRNINIKKLI
jgi:elongation of very long chain fatty acids protein 4